MNSACVDLIYIDPPFNSNVDYAAPIGSEAAGAEFKDTWTLQDVDIAWFWLLKSTNPALFTYLDSVQQMHSKSMMSYLIYMIPRIIEMHRVLKQTGSMYIHCDPTASHYLKHVTDAVLGKNNFRNEIVWCYKGMPSKSTKFQSKHDIILFYSKSDSSHRTFNVLTTDPDPGSLKTYQSAKRVGYNANHKRNMVTIFDRKKYEKAVADGKIPAGMRESEWDGGRPPMRDWWDDIKILGGPKNKERTGYPTQKPLALLERIISASSDPGDLVFDPFCGCATTCVAAQKLNRQWAGIDISEKAADLVVARIHKELGLWSADHTHRNDIPQRTDLQNLPPYNCQYNKDLLYGKQNGRCNYCQVQFEKRNLTVDHIIASSRGGTDHIQNLQFLCGNCNSIKGSKTPQEALAVLVERGIVKSIEEMLKRQEANAR